MVRNESQVLPRLLKSLEKVKNIKGVLLCDTGSTDDTLSLASAWSKRTNIRLHLEQIQFENFEQARNTCLQRMVKFRVPFGENEWVALMDADFTLERGDFSEEVPTQDVNVIQIYPSQTGRPHNALSMLVRANTLAHACTYRMWTHEYLECKGGASYGRYNGFHYVDHSDGSSRPDKLTRDIRLLKKWLKVRGVVEEELRPRALYYLARAYEDNGELERAANTYKRHNEVQTMTNYQFYARYRLALIEMKSETRTQDGVMKALIEAFGTYDGIFRREPLYYMTRLFRTQKEYDKCIIYGTAGMNLPPIQYERVPLFLESTIYDWALEEELAICLYAKMHYQKAYEHFWKIRERYRSVMDETSQQRVDAEIASCEERLK